MAKTLSDAEIVAQIPQARRRAARLRRTVPHADAVSFDPVGKKVVIELTNAASLGIPIALIPGLERASGRDLAEVVVGPAGVAIRWPRLDVDVTVAGIARLALGAGVLLRAAGAAGGSARTPAKKEASRLNGLRGGRPRKNPAHS